MIDIDFDVFESFYWEVDLFSGTRTGTKMVLREYIVDRTRGYGQEDMFFKVCQESASGRNEDENGQGNIGLPRPEGS